MPTDFRASQIQVNKIIASGSTGTTTNALLLIYPISKQSGSNQGFINTSSFGLTGIGTDVFLFVSGAINSRGTAGSNATTVFGGDVHISGNLTFPNGIDPYWTSNVTNVIFTTGSIEVTGSVKALSLSASNGATITGSLRQGFGNTTDGLHSHAEGDRTLASGDYSHAEGNLTTASLNFAHSEGVGTLASGVGSHAEGLITTASFNYSHSEGQRTISSGESAHAEGYGTLASAIGAHSEGRFTTGSNQYSHAEGDFTIAAGVASHAEGQYTSASGPYSHAEGYAVTASGVASHAEGFQTETFGEYSHAGGQQTIASGSYQTVFGKFNKRNNTDSLFVIGNGTADSSRRDAFLVNQSNVMIGSGSLGADIFLFVSGVINGNSSDNNKTVLPDTVLSGNIWMKSSSLNSGNIIYNGNRTGGIKFHGFDMSLIETFVSGKIQITRDLSVVSNTDTFLFVSGNKGTRDKVSLFGGDTFVSGTFMISAENGDPAQLFFVSGTVFPFQIYKDTGISWYISNYDPVTPDLSIYSDTGKILLNAPAQYISASNFIVIDGFRFKASRMSGSLQRLTDGTPAFVSGGNILITTQSNGAVAITGSATYLTVGSYVSTMSTSSNPQIAGQATLDQGELFNVRTVYLRNILSVTTGTITASLRLYNITSGSYVHIGGPTFTILSTSNTTPTQLQSVNLLSATNFGTGSNIYEVQVYTSDGTKQAVLGSSMFVCV